MKARITKVEEKGADNFNGMVFIKFASPEKREVAMKQFNDSKNVFGETRNFMNKDFPVQHRMGAILKHHINMFNRIRF